MMEWSQRKAVFSVTVCSTAGLRHASSSNRNQPLVGAPSRLHPKCYLLPMHSSLIRTLHDTPLSAFPYNSYIDADSFNGSYLHSFTLKEPLCVVFLFQIQVTEECALCLSKHRVRLLPRMNQFWRRNRKPLIRVLWPEGLNCYNIKINSETYFFLEISDWN